MRLKIGQIENMKRDMVAAGFSTRLADIMITAIFTASGVWREDCQLKDSTRTTLPALATDEIDGELVQNESRVLFTALSDAAANNRVYTANIVESNLYWTIATDGINEDGSPFDGDMLVVREGDAGNDSMWMYSSSLWKRMGNTVAAASSVDNDIARFDGVTGQLLKSGLAYATANTASTVVQRDASGNFTAGTITAALNGNATTATSATTATTATTATNFSGSLAGDVTGTQGATAISAAAVTGKLLTGYSSGAGTLSATDTILQGFNKLNGNVAAKGDTFGPAGAVSGRIASFDGVTGKLLKDSLVLVSKPNTNSISIGSAGDGVFDGATTMGISAGGSGTGVSTFGRNAFLSGAGDQTSVFGAYGAYYLQGTVNTIIGYAAHFGPVSGSGNVIIGANSGHADYTPSGGIGLGAGNVVRASNQMVVGGPTYYINDVYFGKGVDHSSPVAVVLQGTNGVGTNVNGAKTTYAAARGTGTGTSIVAFATGATLGSGTTLQTLTDRMSIDGTGAIDILSGHHRYTQIATPATPDAGKTALYFKTDDKLYKKTSAGTETEIGGASGAGDVVGPATSVDYSVPTFDGVTGELLRDSAVKLKWVEVDANLLCTPNAFTLTSGQVNTIFASNSSTSISSGTGNTLVGSALGSITTQSYNALLGYHVFANANAGACVGIGYYVGAGLTASLFNTFVGGWNGSGGSLTNATGCTFLGYGAGGYGAAATLDYAVAIGYESFPTASNQLVIGSNGSGFIDNAYLGSGVLDASPVASMTINATGGSGTDIAGTTMRIGSGRGTGTGASVLALATGAVLGTGTTLQTLTDRLTINGSGLVTISSGNLKMHTGGAALNGFSTGEINLVAGGTERVQVSAGSSNTTDVSGGEVQLVGGESTASGTGVGGAIVLLGGNATDGTGDGGYVGLYAGNSTGGTGGNIDIAAGTGSSNGRIFMSTNTAERFSIDAAGKITIGTAGDTTTVHALNGAYSAAAPGATTGKLKININGTEYYIALTAV